MNVLRLRILLIKAQNIATISTGTLFNMRSCLSALKEMG